MRVTGARERILRDLTKQVYEARQGRRMANPEGTFDNAGRWYPSAREDADGDGSRGRTPSRSWPYSYMQRCRTRQHSRLLVERGLAGLDVPEDVATVVAAVREDVIRAIVVGAGADK